MSLKEQINKDFTAAFKAGQIEKKTTLGMIKTKITEAEKKNGSQLTDNEVISVIQSYNKQLDQTLAAYGDSPNTVEAVNKIQAEKLTIGAYLPSLMGNDEITSAINDFISKNEGDSKKMFGGIMKFFKENYNGRYDAVTLKGMTETILDSKK